MLIVPENKIVSAVSLHMSLVYMPHVEVRFIMAIHRNNHSAGVSHSYVYYIINIH